MGNLLPDLCKHPSPSEVPPPLFLATGRPVPLGAGLWPFQWITSSAADFGCASPGTWNHLSFRDPQRRQSVEGCI